MWPPRSPSGLAVGYKLPVFSRSHQGQHHECLSFSQFILSLSLVGKCLSLISSGLGLLNLPQCRNTGLFSGAQLLITSSRWLVLLLYLRLSEVSLRIQCSPSGGHLTAPTVVYCSPCARQGPGYLGPSLHSFLLHNSMGL